MCRSVIQSSIYYATSGRYVEIEPDVIRAGLNDRKYILPGLADLGIACTEPEPFGDLNRKPTGSVLRVDATPSHNVVS
jgi:hypothetical protein